MTAGTVAGSGRRRGGATGPPMTDTFAGTFDTTKWPNSAGSVSNVSGRLRIIPTTAFPQAASADIFDLKSYPISVQVPTIPAIGNGGIKTKFILSDSTFANQVYFQLEGSGTSRDIFLHGTPAPTNVSGSNAPAYDAVAHQYWRFRISGANLLYEASPDDAAWTTLRTVVTPTWLTTTLARAILQTYFTGTEPTPGFAEFDNFNV